MGFSASELALLLLRSAGAAAPSEPLELRTDDEVEVEDLQDDDVDEHEDGAGGAGDVLFEAEYRTMTLEKDLRWPAPLPLL
jgi:hypothetical protein